MGAGVSKIIFNMSEFEEFIYAIQNKELATVGRFIENHPDINNLINTTDENGNAPLFHAARTGSLEMVECLLNVPEINIKATNQSGWSAMDEALYHGHYASAKTIQCNLGPSYEQRLENIGYKLSNDDAWCICPITLCVMDYPVTLSSGQTYDRASVIQIARIGETFKDPLTRQVLISSEELKHATNHQMKKTIEALVLREENKFHQAVEVEIYNQETYAPHALDQHLSVPVGSASAQLSANTRLFHPAAVIIDSGNLEESTIRERDCCCLIF